MPHATFPKPHAAITPELIERVRKIAAKLAGSVDEGDLFDAAMMGLAKAVHHWNDEEMVGDFDGYAVTAARNAMKQELRDRDILTRDERGEVRQAEKSAARLAHELGRVPRASEIARDLGISFEAYRDVLAAADAGHIELHDGIHAATPFGTVPPDAMHTQEACVDLLKRIERMQEEVEDLPPRLAEVIRLYYEEGLVLKEIGERLGISEGRASQLVREAIAKLRERMTRKRSHGQLTLRPQK